MPGDSVVIAYLHDNTVSHSWHASYMAAVMYDMRPGGPAHLRGGHVAHYGAPLGFDDSRNAVVRTFLDNYDADWLWWCDSDMGFAPDSLERLLACADKDQRPIVGGLCFAYEPIVDDGCHGKLMRPKPTVYAFDERETVAGVQSIVRYPVNELIQVGATGAAFLVVHRSVFERMREAFGETWYDRLPHPKNKVKFGEDISFCVRAANLGIPVHIHTGIRTNHHKHVWVSEANHLQSMAAPPADQEVAVVVPVVGRPQNAAPFMESLRASTGLARVHVMAEESDPSTIEAWTDAGAYQVMTRAAMKSFAEKVNYGARLTSEPWIFIVGDDVKFHPGWYDEALHVAKLNAAKVIGTNDLANPRVLDGEHATHLLIARDYIDEVGASWDGPGIVCHEGYRHWFVDDEIVTAAKQRGVWAMALASFVEHHHPLFGTAPDDETYRKGQRHAGKDEALWLRRLREHTSGVAA